MKLLQALLLTLLIISAEGADTWTNADGKTITADFIRMDGNTVVLKMRGMNYPVPIEKLSEKSQHYALYLSKELNKWATANLKMPIIPEEVLTDIIAYNSQLTEGRHYLVSGTVKSLRSNSGGLNPPDRLTATIELTGGTEVASDFAEQADGRRAKIEVEDDRVMLLKARSFSGGKDDWHNFTPDKALVSVGQSIIVRAKVHKGKIEGTGLPSSQEVTQARVLAAKSNGGLSTEGYAQIEKIKIRIEYLEAVLAGDAGSASYTGIHGTSGSVTMGSITYQHSKAEEEAMRKELELLRAQLAAAAKP
jgi:hypothetical protein